jgi:hypothetical protein
LLDIFGGVDRTSALGIKFLGCIFFVYLAGFAFMATPGKAGELIRVHYLLKVGGPVNVSFGAFVYEKGCWI